jgi:transcriptional regulator with GAF, ATPase, and Fis domain
VANKELRLADLLATTAQELVVLTEADACAISRVVGDVLIVVAKADTKGGHCSAGRGYLVPDFPETQHVLETRSPRALTLAEEGVDPAETEALKDLGFASLLMLPLDLGDEAWGLVEVYRVEARPFSLGQQLAAVDRLAQLA